MKETQALQTQRLRSTIGQEKRHWGQASSKISRTIPQEAVIRICDSLDCPHHRRDFSGSHGPMS